MKSHPLHTSRFTRAAVTIGLAALTTPVAPVLGQVLHEDLKLLANDGEATDWFGYRIDIKNGIVAVGAWWNDENGDDSGSAYLFDVSTGEQVAKLLPNDGMAGDRFGASIAIDNGIVAVGAPGNDDNGTSSGSAYLFDMSTGVQFAKLLPSDGAMGDFFGESIAFDNGIIVLGATGDDDNGAYSGSVYLFDASTGVQLTKLLPLDGAAGDMFGESIAIESGIVAVGARFDSDNGSHSGSAYLFDVPTGVQYAKLLPSDGSVDDNFGFSISIAYGIVAVGAFTDDDNGMYSGSAYLFDALTGVQYAKLLPSDGTMGDFFGHSITVGDGVVIVGARRATHSGSAYVFETITGVQIAKLLPSDGAPGDRFGFSIAVDSGIVAVGATEDDDNNYSSGSAYLFAFDCPADTNRDGVVDTLDFLMFLNAWQVWNPLADWNVDGMIDSRDFLAYLGDWAAGCS